MAKRGLELLVEGAKNLLDGIAGAVGGIIHATGSTARGAGRGTKRVFEGVEEGLEEAGKGGGYATHGAGYGIKGVGKFVNYLGRKISKSEDGQVELSERDVERLARFEPSDLKRELIHLEHSQNGPYTRMSVDDLNMYINHIKGYGLPIRHHRPAAVIIFALALVLLMPLSITGFAIAGNLGNSVSYIEFIGILALLGALYLFSRKQ